MLKQIYLEHKTAARVLFRAVWHNYGPAVFVLLFFAILFVLQWVFEYEQFYQIIIVNEGGLSFLDKLDVLFDALFSFFRYPNDLTPIALILISFFQAAIGIIWLRIRSFKKSYAISASALGVGVVGSGCVACGSSLLNAFFSVVGSTVSVGFIRVVGDFLLIAATFLAYKAFIQLANKVSRHFHE